MFLNLQMMNSCYIVFVRGKILLNNGFEQVPHSVLRWKKKKTFILLPGLSFNVEMYKPCDKDAGNLRRKRLSHLSAAHVGDAVQGQVHEGGVAAAEVILDGIIDEANQITVRVHQHWDEQVPLKDIRKKGFLLEFKSGYFASHQGSATHNP